MFTWERVRGCRLRVLVGNALLEASAGRMTGRFVEVWTGRWDLVRMSRYPGRLVARNSRRLLLPGPEGSRGA